MAILDGKRVSNLEINPLKHRFIGTFREPNMPNFQGADIVLCSCREHLWSNSSVDAHWRMGHFDELQYQTIDWSKNND